MVAGKSAPRNPSQCEQRQQQADPEFRALQWRLPLEIVEVDALRELFCCACACHVSLNCLGTAAGTAKTGCATHTSTTFDAPTASSIRCAIPQRRTKANSAA